MKCINLLLVLATFLCYSGICGGISYSYNAMGVTNTGCHGTQKKANPDSTNSYKSSDKVNHNIHMCQEALISAPTNFDLNIKEIILDSVAVIFPIMEINGVPSFTLSLNIKEHHPPDLFLVKSSLLL